MRSTLRRLVRRLVRGKPRASAPAVEAPARPVQAPGEALIRSYHENGGKPWTPGYKEYHDQFITRVLIDPGQMELFRRGLPLPAGYGPRLDERVVEFPWVLSQLDGCGRRVLDAGSTLNHLHVLSHPGVQTRSLIICTLAPEWQLARANVSYLYGDLRDTVLRDGCMDVVASISTLEHIGMDNTMIYTKDARFRECDLTAYRQALAEFRRVLVPGGVALITVPFGKHENHGWTQQFDRAGVQDIIDAFGGRVESLRYYRYRPDGWVTATAEECADCAYFNIHATPEFDPDHAAAARAVACLRLVRE